MTKPNEITNLQKPNLIASRLRFEYGSFQGFNFRNQSAIEGRLSATDIMAWDHDRCGEAEFWPSGDSPALTLLFDRRTSVTASELLALDQLLTELGSDSLEHYVRIYHGVQVRGADLLNLDAASVQDSPLHLFFGDCFYDLRKDAAYELFELYHPEVYRVWEAHPLDGLHFDTDDFLDSPVFHVEELTLGNINCLLVADQ